MNTSLLSNPATQPPSARPRRRRGLIIGSILGAVVVVGSVSAYLAVSADRPVTDIRPAEVAVASIDGVGDVLVDGDGQVLYLFEPDEAHDVTCTGGCAAKWPPLTVDIGTDPMIGSGVSADRVGLVRDQDGTPVATFDGWPLYRYTSDELGQMTGSGRDQNGGKWWALTPAGERVEP